MNTASPVIIIIAGPNGAGKSTLAPHLLKDAFGLLEYVNADTIAQGLSAFSPESVAFEAGRIMLARLRDLADDGASFAFESTLATRFYASWIGELRDKKGYDFHLIYLWLRSPELAVERVRSRVRLGGHHVPEEIVRRRYRKGLDNFFSLYQPLAETWTVFDNSEAGHPIIVAEGTGTAELNLYEESIWRKINSD